MESYIDYNGKYYLTNELLFDATNRAFRYGDAIFETMRASGRKVAFFNEHYNRLIEGMKLLKMNIPDNFTPDFLHDSIERLLHQNRLYQGANVRLTVWRSGSGKYTPQTNNIEYLLQCDKLETEKYALNKKGLMIDIFDEVPYTKTPFSSFKTANALAYILAGVFAKEKQLNEAILINEHGNLVEGISTNLFVYKKKQLFTPALSDGCVAGIMREKIIEIALNKKFTVFDECSLTANDLTNAEEIWLTNSVAGIKWVSGFKQRRYYKFTANEFIADLNQFAFKPT